MGEVFIWGLFNQVAINPFVWGTPTDPEVVERVRDHDIPQVLDYLESEAPADGFRFGELSIADVAIACFFRNAAFARYEVDRSRWPRTASWVARTLALPSFVKLEPFEQKSARTPIPKQREALAAIGAPLTDESWGTADAAPRHDEDLSGAGRRAPVSQASSQPRLRRRGSAGSRGFPRRPSTPGRTPSRPRRTDDRPRCRASIANA